MITGEEKLGGSISARRKRAQFKSLTTELNN